MPESLVQLYITALNHNHPLLCSGRKVAAGGCDKPGFVDMNMLHVLIRCSLTHTRSFATLICVHHRHTLWSNAVKMRMEGLTGRSLKGPLAELNRDVMGVAKV